eukprot:GDKJ01007882.1.p1 GENE.GDKJ01007882.1~~GDKJ01007882.1.p1  ORF type:complete len:1957 (+),score=496.26 GDKJ01007882.1:404-5872(+)
MKLAKVAEADESLLDFDETDPSYYHRLVGGPPSLYHPLPVDENGDPIISHVEKDVNSSDQGAFESWENRNEFDYNLSNSEPFKNMSLPFGITYDNNKPREDLLNSLSNNSAEKFTDETDVHQFCQFTRTVQEASPGCSGQSLQMEANSQSLYKNENKSFINFDHNPEEINSKVGSEMESLSYCENNNKGLFDSPNSQQKHLDSVMKCSNKEIQNNEDSFNFDLKSNINTSSAFEGFDSHSKTPIERVGVFTLPFTNKRQISFCSNTNFRNTSSDRYDQEEKSDTKEASSTGKASDYSPQVHGVSITSSSDAAFEIEQRLQILACKDSKTLPQSSHSTVPTALPVSAYPPSSEKLFLPLSRNQPEATRVSPCLSRRDISPSAVCSSASPAQASPNHPSRFGCFTEDSLSMVACDDFSSPDHRTSHHNPWGLSSSSRCESTTAAPLPTSETVSAAPIAEKGSKLWSPSRSLSAAGALFDSPAASCSLMKKQVPKNVIKSDGKLQGDSDEQTCVSESRFAFFQASNSSQDAQENDHIQATNVIDSHTSSFESHESSTPQSNSGGKQPAKVSFQKSSFKFFDSKNAKELGIDDHESEHMSSTCSREDQASSSSSQRSEESSLDLKRNFSLSIPSKEEKPKLLYRKSEIQPLPTPAFDSSLVKRRASLPFGLFGSSSNQSSPSFIQGLPSNKTSIFGGENNTPFIPLKANRESSPSSSVQSSDKECYNSNKIPISSHQLPSIPTKLPALTPLPSAIIPHRRRQSISHPPSLNLSGQFLAKDRLKLYQEGANPFRSGVPQSFADVFAGGHAANPYDDDDDGCTTTRSGGRKGFGGLVKNPARSIICANEAWSMGGDATRRASVVSLNAAPHLIHHTEDVSPSSSTAQSCFNDGLPQMSTFFSTNTQLHFSNDNALDSASLNNGLCGVLPDDMMTNGSNNIYGVDEMMGQQTVPTYSKISFGPNVVEGKIACSSVIEYLMEYEGNAVVVKGVDALRMFLQRLEEEEEHVESSKRLNDESEAVSFGIKEDSDLEKTAPPSLALFGVDFGLECASNKENTPVSIENQKISEALVSPLPPFEEEEEEENAKQQKTSQRIILEHGNVFGEAMLPHAFSFPFTLPSLTSPVANISPCNTQTSSLSTSRNSQIFFSSPINSSSQESKLGSSLHMFQHSFSPEPFLKDSTLSPSAHLEQHRPNASPSSSSASPSLAAIMKSHFNQQSFPSTTNNSNQNTPSSVSPQKLNALRPSPLLIASSCSNHAAIPSTLSPPRASSPSVLSPSLGNIPASAVSSARRSLIQQISEVLSSSQNKDLHAFDTTTSGLVEPRPSSNRTRHGTPPASIRRSFSSSSNQMLPTSPSLDTSRLSSINNNNTNGNISGPLSVSAVGLGTSTLQQSNDVNGVSGMTIKELLIMSTTSMNSSQMAIPQKQSNPLIPHPNSFKLSQTDDYSARMRAIQNENVYGGNSVSDSGNSSSSRSSIFQPRSSSRRGTFQEGLLLKASIPVNFISSLEVPQSSNANPSVNNFNNNNLGNTCLPHSVTSPIASLRSNTVPINSRSPLSPPVQCVPKSCRSRPNLNPSALLESEMSGFSCSVFDNSPASENSGGALQPCSPCVNENSASESSHQNVGVKTKTSFIITSPASTLSLNTVCTINNELSMIAPPCISTNNSTLPPTPASQKHNLSSPSNFDVESHHYSKLNAVDSPVIKSSLPFHRTPQKSIKFSNNIEQEISCKLSLVEKDSDQLFPTGSCSNKLALEIAVPSRKSCPSNDHLDRNTRFVCPETRAEMLDHGCDATEDAMDSDTQSANVSPSTVRNIKGRHDIELDFQEDESL